MKLWMFNKLCVCLSHYYKTWKWHFCFWNAFRFFNMFRFFWWLYYFCCHFLTKILNFEGQSRKISKTQIAFSYSFHFTPFNVFPLRFTKHNCTYILKAFEHFPFFHSKWQGMAILNRIIKKKHSADFFKFDAIHPNYVG